MPFRVLLAPLPLRFLLAAESKRKPRCRGQARQERLLRGPRVFPGSGPRLLSRFWIPGTVEAPTGSAASPRQRSGPARASQEGGPRLSAPGPGLASPARRAAMPGRALRRAAGPPSAGPLGGLRLWVLGGLCGLGAGVLLADAWGPPGTPRPCQAPQQWEGRQVLYRQSSGRNSRALLSYDGLHRRVRVLDERKALVPCKRYAGRPGVGLPGRILPTKQKLCGEDRCGRQGVGGGAEPI